MSHDAAFPAIRLRGVTMRYGRHRVLDGLDLDVEAGATTVLLGTNGAGKTTLLRLCLGVLRPRSGEVRVLGLDPVRRARRLRPRVGYVPDRPDVWPWMTVRDLFRFLAPHYPTWDAARARETCERLAVPTDRSFRAMSRGEGMKAMLAAALAPAPEVLLLDEPFGGLDPLVREEVLRHVIGAIDDTARTILVSTHDLDVAARVADRIAVLAHGRIEREGAPAEVVGRLEAATPASLQHALAEAGATR